MYYNNEMIKEVLLEKTEFGEEKIKEIINWLEEKFNVIQSDQKELVKYVVDDILHDVTTLIISRFFEKEDLGKIKLLKEKYLSVITD